MSTRRKTSRESKSIIMPRQPNKHGRRRWSKEETELLRRIYPAKEMVEILQALPLRTEGAVTQRASKLNIHRLIQHPPHTPWGENNGRWKGDSARPETKRARAQRRYPLGKCLRCQNQATDRHHRDGNTGNNDPTNIETLCRRCHMETDGRLDKFRAEAKASNESRRVPPLPCAHCGRLKKPLRHGLCSACSEYKRRHGVDRPLLSNSAARRREEAAGPIRQEVLGI